MPEYVFDQTWEAERERLAGIERLWDPGAQAIMERLGIGAGWRCLEVGGGGSMTEWMAERVGPENARGIPAARGVREAPDTAFFRLTLETLRRPLVEGGRVSDQEIERELAAIGDRANTVGSPTLVAGWGKRPL